MWRDLRYLPAISTDLHDEDQPAEQQRAPTPANGGHHPGAATLDDFLAVAQRSKAKPRLLPLKRSGPSSDVESGHRGGPSPSSHSAASQRGKVVVASERVCGMPCDLQAAGNRAAQQNAAVDRAVLIAQEQAHHRKHGMAIIASAVATVSAEIRAQLCRKRRLPVRGVRAMQPRGKQLLLTKLPPPRRPLPGRRRK